MAKAKLELGDTVYANFERSDGKLDVVYGVVDDIKGNLIACNWEHGGLESSMYYDEQYIHLVERKQAASD